MATLPELVLMHAALSLEEREILARLESCEREIHRLAVSSGLVSRPSYEQPQEFVCAGKLVKLTVKTGRQIVALKEIGSLPRVDDPVRIATDQETA